MVLDQTKAVEVIKNPASKSHISSVKNLESQLRVFTEDMTTFDLASEVYWQSLLTQMKARSSKKFDRVIQFARYPLPVVQITDSVLNDYYKVFEGKNRFFNFEGDRDIDRLRVWTEQNKPAKWIEDVARDVFKNKPNTFVVIDRNDEGEIYLIEINSDRLIDAKFKTDEGDLEYICFIHSQRVEQVGKEQHIFTKYSVYDDENWYVFEKGNHQDQYVLISAEKHHIGYCPAKSFIKSPSNSKNPFKRRVAFTSALSKLEDWTMFDIYRNFVDHYAPFPVTEAPKKKCGNPECTDGVVEEEVIDNDNPGQTKITYATCNICGGSDGGQHIFPGTHIGIEVQRDKGENDGSGVFKMIFPDTEAMKYVPEKLDDLELEIRFKTVGINNIMESEAFNEMQVKGSFASMETMLLRTKSELDCLYTWIIQTVGRIMYKNINIRVEANFGTEWYLVGEEDLQKRYQQAKTIGLPTEELMNIYKQLIETKYKGNNMKMSRNLMLTDLDPYPVYSISDCINFKKEGVIDEFELMFKTNFLKYIAKFERENATITEFGLTLDYWKRIEIIKNTLDLYNEEEVKKKSDRLKKVDKPGDDGNKNE